VQRLREGQVVTFELPAPERGEPPASLSCSVVAVHGDEVALLGHDPPPVPRLPDVLAGIYMTFRHGTALVALHGAIGANEDPTDLRFWVTDGVHLPRRRSTRHRLRLPLEVAGQEVETVNVSADGALVAPAGSLAVGETVGFRVGLEGAEPIEGSGTVVRVEDDQAALHFVGLEADDRIRLKEHVIALMRTEVARARSASAVMRTPWLSSRAIAA
jgi:hypothetical protein